MKTADDFKNEFNLLKENIKELIKLNGLKFTIDEFLSFDSIAYNSLLNIELNIDPKKLAKQDYLILANETYFIEDENFKKIEKKTRTTLFSIKKSKLLKLDADEIFETLLSYIKLIENFKRYKILRKDFDNFILLNFPEVTTWYLLMSIYGIGYCEEKMQEYKNETYYEYLDLQLSLKEEERMASMFRSSKLEEKLKKK